MDAGGTGVCGHVPTGTNVFLELLKVVHNSLSGVNFVSHEGRKKTNYFRKDGQRGTFLF